METHLRIVWAFVIRDAGLAGEIELTPTVPTVAQMIGAHNDIVTVIRLVEATGDAPGVDLILDGDACCAGRVANPGATTLAEALGWEGDGLIGPAMFMGTDAEGDPTDVPATVAVLYRQLTGHPFVGR